MENVRILDRLWFSNTALRRDRRSWPFRKREKSFRVTENVPRRKSPWENFTAILFVHANRWRSPLRFPIVSTKHPVFNALQLIFSVDFEYLWFFSMVNCLKVSNYNVVMKRKYFKIVFHSLDFFVLSLFNGKHYYLRFVTQYYERKYFFFFKFRI